MRFLLLLSLLAGPGLASTRLLVTIVHRRSGEPVKDLKAGDFSVTEEGRARRVEGAEFVSGPVDIMLLLDTSLVGPMVQPIADNLIAQLEAKEQMAIVTFHESADLVQDFTSSRELLHRAIAGVKYGNEPRVLDALYASLREGLSGASLRRVLLLLTAGIEGYSRIGEREVLRLARRNGVSIYPVYVMGGERSLFESLGRQTGGASFNLRDMKRSSEAPPGRRIFEVLRSYYVLTLTGSLSLGERLKVEVQRPEKLFVSTLPLD